MQYPTLVCLLVCLVALFAAAYGQDDDGYNMDKRAMRNALVRFGRATGMRNALVRFGKRSSPDVEEFGQALQDKRNAGVPQPFVRFGRSSQMDHLSDMISTLQRLESVGSK